MGDDTLTGVFWLYANYSTADHSLYDCDIEIMFLVEKRIVDQVFETVTWYLDIFRLAGGPFFWLRVFYHMLSWSVIQVENTFSRTPIRTPIANSWDVAWDIDMKKACGSCVTPVLMF